MCRKTMPSLVEDRLKTSKTTASERALAKKGARRSIPPLKPSTGCGQVHPMAELATLQPLDLDSASALGIRSFVVAPGIESSWKPDS